MHNTNPAFYLSGNSCFYPWPPLALFPPAIDVLGYLQHLYLGPTILKKGEAVTYDVTSVTCDTWGLRPESLPRSTASESNFDVSVLHQ